MKLFELQEQRSAAVSEMRALADKIEGESRDYSTDEAAKHTALKTKIVDLDAKITRAKEIQELERSAPAVISGNGKDGQYEERARSFSLVKAINAAIGEQVDVGFEREISAEVSRRAGRKFQGIAVPDEFFHTEKRVLTVGSAAADLVPNVHRGDLFVDALRDRIIVGQLGATVLDGLVGTVDIPKQSASSTAEWLAEEDSITPSDASFTDINLSPKTIGSISSYSRRTLLNSVPSIEAIVRNDLASVIANGIDRAALVGTGSSNQPTGVRFTSSVNNLTLAGPTWAQALAFPAAVQSANADIGSFGWAMGPRAVSKLRSTVRVSSTDSQMLMDTASSFLGYPVATTNVLDTFNSPDINNVLFGVWSQLLVGYWSGTDILVNPYESTAYLKGRVMIRAMRDVDIAVRHPEAFAFAEDLPAS